MGLLDFFKKKNNTESCNNISDKDIVAIADGELFDVTEVKDPTFSQQLLGKSVAFKFKKERVAICSPINGKLTTVFPTGHAFGVSGNNGVEILVHIGIDTVNAKGDGFRLGNFNQGDKVRAGDAIVNIDMKRLSKVYDMSTVLIITNSNNQEINFIKPQQVTKGQSILK